MKRSCEPGDDIAMTNSAQYLDASMLLDVCSHLNLMFLLTNEDFVIQFASPSLEAHLDRKLVESVLMDVIPAMAGIDQELNSIIVHQAEPWRIRGIQLVESGQNQYDVLLMPRSDNTGLILAVWQMDFQSMVEQMLRQQRNELTLSFDKLAEQASALRTANDRLASLERERHALLDLIVQDIKSAVSVIAGYSELLSAELALPVGSESQKALDAIRDSALGMTALVKSALVLERIERKLLHIDWQPLPLPQLVQDVVAMWQSVATTQDVHIEVYAENDLSEIEGDVELLREAVQVLVERMLSMATRGADVVIRISAWDRWNVIHFEHLPSKTQSTKHLPHQKLQSKSTASSDLKLALARLIIEGHGGHLSVEEDGCQGIVFSLWLLQETAQGRREKDMPSVDVAPKSVLRIVGQGSIRINTTSQLVWLNNDPVSLTDSEYRLLLYLAEHVDHVVSHEQLAKAVWSRNDSEFVDSLRVLVWRLRQKLSGKKDKSQYLRTVRGFGYMLVS